MMNSNRHIPSDGSFVSSVDSFETATETSSAESSVLHSKKDHEMSMPQHPQSGCCIIINGLLPVDDQYIIQVICHVFMKLCQITSIRITRHESSNMPYVFIQYISENVNQVIDQLNGLILDQRAGTLCIKKAGTTKTLVISRLNQKSVDEKTLMQSISKYGKVKEVIPAKYKGFKGNGWFVEMGNHDETITAYSHLISGGEWDVTWTDIEDSNTTPRRENTPTTPIDNDTNGVHSIYIGQVSPEVTEQILYEKFRKHGNLLNIVLKKNASRNSMNYAFIDYDTKKSAETAVQEENYSTLMGNTIVVQYQADSSRKSSFRAGGNSHRFSKSDSIGNSASHNHPSWQHREANVYNEYLHGQSPMYNNNFRRSNSGSGIFMFDNDPGKHEDEKQYPRSNPSRYTSNKNDTNSNQYTAKNNIFPHNNEYSSRMMYNLPEDMMIPRHIPQHEFYSTQNIHKTNNG